MGRKSLPSLTAPVKLPGMIEKESQNRHQTHLDVYWGGGVVYRPGESACREREEDGGF